MIRHILSFCLLIIFCLSTVGIVDIPGVSALEDKAYDLRVNMTTLDDNDPRIVILDIDEKSLKSLGRWPWNRLAMADLLDTLFDHYFIQVLGFDILFAEPDNSSGLPVLESLAKGPLRDNPAYQSFLEENATNLNYDHLFAKSLKDRDTVMGFFFRNEAIDKSASLNLGTLPQPLAVENHIDTTNSFNNASGYGANLKLFQDAAMDAGFIDNPSISDDGIIRKVPLIQYFDGNLYQSFALGLIRALYGFPPIKLEYDADNILYGISVFDKFIPTTTLGEVYVPYRGIHPKFEYVSVIDVLEKKVDLEVLDGAIVLMGTTATGLLDMRATPVENVYPGVEIHANIISGFLDDSFKYQPIVVQDWNLLQHFFIGLILVFALPRLNLLFSVMLGATLILAVAMSNAYFWQTLQIIMPLVSILLFILLNFIFHFGYGYFVEDSNKRKMKSLFGQYVPPELVDEMSKDNAVVSLEGETKELTILFSDIRGFTSLSEQLNPQQLTSLMNQYLTEMTHIILNNRGTIDKYIGDAIMAFWGAPLSDPDHAAHAVQAAADMQAAIPKLNESFKQQGFPEISIGIGLNTGAVNVGNMGSEFRMAYTVLGDDVNLASRLESITKQYKVDLIVSERTKEKAPEWIYQELDLVRVVGKNIPISIFHPISKKAEINELQQKEMYLFKVAVKLYREQKWDEAKSILEELMEATHNAFLYKLYLGRVIACQENPPGEKWDGVFQAKSK